jgi:hypothetical protein
MADITGSDVITFIRKDPNAVLRALQVEHRTLQQATVGALYGILKTYGTNDTDLRNEDAVAWAKKATAEVQYFPFL